MSNFKIQQDLSLLEPPSEAHDVICWFLSKGRAGGAFPAKGQQNFISLCFCEEAFV